MPRVHTGKLRGVLYVSQQMLQNRMPGVQKGYAEQQLCREITDQPKVILCGAELLFHVEEPPLTRLYAQNTCSVAAMMWRLGLCKAASCYGVSPAVCGTQVDERMC